MLKSGRGPNTYWGVRGSNMENLKSVVAKNIIYLRTQNQMTQYELGEKLNYSDKAVSKWERGEAIPDAYILKKLSEIFSVSVDFLLSVHDKEEKIHLPSVVGKRLTITNISVVGIWTLAILIFVVFSMFGHTPWLIFAYTLPISLIVLLVLNSVWGKAKINFYLISALVWSLIAVFYFTFIEYNWWQLFFLGFPAELLIFLSFRLLKKAKH